MHLVFLLDSYKIMFISIPHTSTACISPIRTLVIPFMLAVGGRVFLVCPGLLPMLGYPLLQHWAWGRCGVRILKGQRCFDKQGPKEWHERPKEPSLADIFPKEASLADIFYLFTFDRVRLLLSDLFVTS